MSANVRGKVHAPRWPNFVQFEPAGRAGPGAIAVDIGSLDDKAVEDLVEDFRRHVQRRSAGAVAAAPEARPAPSRLPPRFA
jgi:hypothetical protein